MKYRNEVILAGLLHDIGKFYLRSGKRSGNIGGLNLGGTHQELSVKFVESYSSLFEPFVDIDAVREMVQRHHEGKYVAKKADLLDVKNAPEEYKRYCKIIALADNLSSKERGTRDDDSEIIDDESNNVGYMSAALHSIFIRADAKRGYGYKFSEWSPESIIPIANHNENNTEENYNHIENFAIYMDKLCTVKYTTFEDMYKDLYETLKKFTWCVPSAYQDSIRDISLFDHLSTTSAIAISMYNQLYSKYGDSFTVSNVASSTSHLYTLHIKLNGEEHLIENKKLDGLSVLNEISSIHNYVTGAMNKVVTETIKTGSIANCVIRFGNECFVVVSESELKVIDETLVMLNKEIFDSSGSLLYISYGKSNLKANNILVNITEELSENLLIRMLTVRNKWQTERFKGINTKLSININKSKLFNDESLNYIKIFKLKSYNVLDIIKDKFQNEVTGADYHSISRVSTYMRMVNAYFNESINQICGSNAVNIQIGLGESLIIGSSIKMLDICRKCYQSLSDISSNTLKLHGIVIKLHNKSRVDDILGRLNHGELELLNSNMSSCINYRDNIINWSDLSIIFNLRTEIKEELKRKSLSSNNLYKLKEFSSMYKEYLKTKDTVNLMLYPWFNNFNVKVISSKNSKVSSNFRLTLNRIFDSSSMVKENISLKLLEVAVDETLDLLKRKE